MLKKDYINIKKTKWIDKPVEQHEVASQNGPVFDPSYFWNRRPEFH